MEGVEHVEGFGECIGVTVEMDVTVQPVTLCKKAALLGTASSTGREYEKTCLHIYSNDRTGEFLRNCQRRLRGRTHRH